MIFNDIDKFENFADFLDVFGALLPDDIDKTISINGQKISVTKKDGDIRLNVVSEFDDSGIKNIIANYRKNIDGVDNDVFVEAMSAVQKNISILDMDKLLSQESFTEEEAHKAAGVIEYASKCIAASLKEKIRRLLEVYNRF